MKVAVTGAAGHVGLNLVRSLVDAGHQVRAFDRDFRSLAGLEIERFEGDVRDEAALARCFEGVERVFHLAAIISIDGDRGGLVYDVNVGGARAAAQAALSAGVRRFVHFSSIHAFDARLAGEVDESAPRSGDGSPAYDRSKALGEVEVRRLIERGLDAVVVHPTGVMGPPDPLPSKAGKGILDAARGRLPVIVDGGFDWVDVRDVVASAQAAAERGRRGQSYILSGSHRAMRDVTALAAECAGAYGPLLCLPRGLLRSFAALPALVGRLRGREPLFTAESLDTLGTRARFRNDLAQKELGHQPRPFEETIGDLVDWFIESGQVAAPRARRGATESQLSRFAQHLGAHAVDDADTRNLLARVLAEIASADGSVEVAERALVSQFAAVDADEMPSGPAVSASELSDLSHGQRESLLLVALALAWVDEDFSAVERQAVERLRGASGIGQSRATELEDIAKEFVVDQLFDAIYADGNQDAEERKRVEQMATRLALTPETLARLDARARKRRGLAPDASVGTF